MERKIPSCAICIGIENHQQKLRVNTKLMRV